MRLFLALDTPDLEYDLKKLKTNLHKAKNMEHRWVPEALWHIPLFPLGDMGQESLKLLDEKITAVVNRHAILDLRLEGVWAYPTQEHGRLLWIGVQNSRELRELQQDLINELGAHYTESADEKPFRPHLPIVRLRNHREVSDLISPFKNTSFGKLSVQNVGLFEMTSGGAFPTYRKLKIYHLEAQDINISSALS